MRDTRPPRWFWQEHAACIDPDPDPMPCDGCTVRARCTAANADSVSGRLAPQFLEEVA